MLYSNGIIDSNQKIVTNGLIVNYDAAQLRSYSGSGSTWYDLSGSVNNGTLVNSPTFGTSFGGNFLFNGSNQSVTIPILSNSSGGSLCFWIRYLSGNVTICCWSDTVNGPVVSYSDVLYINASAQLVGYTYDPSFAPAQKFVTDTNAMIVGGYYYCVLTWQNGASNTGNLSVSLNALAKSSVAITTNYAAQNLFYIAARTGISGVNAFNSNIYCAQLYNRSLSSSEIQQNYNALCSRFGLSPITYDNDAYFFFNRVAAAGGSLTLTEKNAVNQLVIDLKANSLWSSMVAIYPMVGASAAACAQNLKSSSYTGTFSGGWTYASTGVTPNGTNGYMNTGLVPNVVLTQNSLHLSIYSRTSNAASNAVEIGSFNTANNYFILQVLTAGNIAYNLLSTFTLATLSNTSSIGFFNSNRNNSTTVSNFKNGTNLGNTTQNSTAQNNFNVYLGNANRDGLPSATGYSNRQYAFASIGSGLSDTDAANFYTVVQAFQTSLSRNV